MNALVTSSVTITNVPANTTVGVWQYLMVGTWPLQRDLQNLGSLATAGTMTTAMSFSWSGKLQWRCRRSGELRLCLGLQVVLYQRLPEPVPHERANRLIDTDD